MIEIDKIYLRDDVVKRAVNRDAVNDLAKSIKASGLHTPIRVRPISKYNSGVRSDAWELIAGRHRVEAAKILGWSEIDANVADIDDDRAELAMIDENLKRKDLEPAELVYATHRRKDVYERLFPGTKNGANQHSRVRNNCEGSDEPDRFTLATAKTTGKSERSVQMAAAIGKKLNDKAPLLVGTSLNSITELEALAKLDDSLREGIIERALRGEDVSAKAALPKRERKSRSQSQRAQPQNTEKPKTDEQQSAAKEDAADTSVFFQHPAERGGAGGGGGSDKEQSATAANEAAPSSSSDDESVAPPWEAEDGQFRALCIAWGEANGGARARFLEWANLSRH